MKDNLLIFAGQKGLTIKKKQLKELQRDEIKYLRSNDFVHLYIKENNLELNRHTRAEAKSVANEKIKLLDDIKLKNSAKKLKKLNAQGAYDPNTNTIIYDKKNAANFQNIYDHETSHLYNEVSAPGYAFTDKVYSIYSRNGIIKNSDEIKYYENIKGISKDEFTKLSEESFSKLNKSYLDKLPSIRKNYYDNAYHYRFDGNNYNEDEIDKILNDKYSFLNKGLGSIRAVNQIKFLRKELNRDTLFIDETDKDVKLFLKDNELMKNYNKEYRDINDSLRNRWLENLNSGAFDEFKVEKYKQNIINNPALNKKNINTYKIKNKKKNDEMYFIKGTEIQARLRSIRDEAVRNGYKLGDKFDGWLNKSTNTSILKQQYDELRDNNEFTDDDINELMLLFSDNTMKMNKENDLLIFAGQNGILTRRFPTDQERTSL